MLLDHGADPNAKPGTNFHYRGAGELTNVSWAVDMAVYYRHLDMVHLLVKAGGLSGMPGVTGLDGAIIVADKYGSSGIVEYLQQYT